MNIKNITAAGVLAAAGICTFRYLDTQYPYVGKPRAGKKIVACVGDSITYGAGVKNHRRDSYPAFLQKQLGEDYQVINYGLNGRTLLSTGDIPYIREKLYRRTFTDSPDIYLCMLGTNDSKPYNWDRTSYEQELAAFLGKYVNAAGTENVFVMIPPRAFAVDGNSSPLYDILDENIQVVAQIIRAVAQRLHIRVIDLYRLTQNHPDWFPDGVHPNRTGNQNIAQAIYAACFKKPDKKEDISPEPEQL